MSESSFDYWQARADQGANRADVGNLPEYLRRVGMDAQSLRHGLAEAGMQVFGGWPPLSTGTNELPYPAHRVERALFDDSMKSNQQLLVADPAVAAALRHPMRLLEDACEAAHLVHALLKRPDGGAAMERVSFEVGPGFGK